MIGRSPSCGPNDECRTLWDIVRSCLITIFLCTWVSVHPNIQGRQEPMSKVMLRRLGIMVAALVAPEVIVLWAMRQRVFAARLADDNKG